MGNWVPSGIGAGEEVVRGRTVATVETVVWGVGGQDQFLTRHTAWALRAVKPLCRVGAGTTQIRQEVAEETRGVEEVGHVI